MRQLATGLTEDAEQNPEFETCKNDVHYFIRNYCQIYDTVTQDWIPFDLWAEQSEVLDGVIEDQFIIVLKARQLGLTWLMLAYIMWLMIFHPIASIMIYSLRDPDAVYLLGNERLRGMFKRLPDWMKPKVVTDNDHTWLLDNGSVARALNADAGDSYTNTFVLVDEADLLEKTKSKDQLKDLLNSAKPTIDAGGKLALISKSNKKQPESMFKRIYREAVNKKNGWRAFFLPWYVHPQRDEAWYKRQCADAMRNSGALDDVYENYPAKDTEALAPASLDKRIPAAWLDAVYVKQDAMRELRADIPELDVYQEPIQGAIYVIGADCAEGLASSDDSTTYVLNKSNLEIVARLVGKLTPAVHAEYTFKIAKWYNNAKIMPENNNHGHAFILWYDQNGHKSMIASGYDNKQGWTSSTRGKMIMYDLTAEIIRDKQTIIHGLDTYTQLASIEKGTLRAPDGLLDDMADGYALAVLCGAYHVPKENLSRTPSGSLYQRKGLPT